MERPVLPPEATEPTAITADRATRTLTIAWADGVTSEISFEALLQTMEVLRYRRRAPGETGRAGDVFSSIEAFEASELVPPVDSAAGGDDSHTLFSNPILVQSAQ